MKDCKELVKKWLKRSFWQCLWPQKVNPAFFLTNFASPKGKNRLNHALEYNRRGTRGH